MGISGKPIVAKNFRQEVEGCTRATAGKYKVHLEVTSFLVATINELCESLKNAQEGATHILNGLSAYVRESCMVQPYKSNTGNSSVSLGTRSLSLGISWSSNLPLM